MNSHCVKLHRSYSISFNLSNLGKIFRSWIQKDRNYVRKTKRKIFTVVFTHSIERAHEIRKFHVAVVQRRLRNVQKGVMHVQSVCFANMNHLLFCRSRCRRPMRCLSSLLLWSRNFATMVTLRHTSPPCRLNKDTLADCCRLEDAIIVDAVAGFFVTTAQISQLCKFNMICFIIMHRCHSFSPSLVLVSQFFGSWILTQTDRGSRSEIGSRWSCRVTSNNKFCL